VVQWNSGITKRLIELVSCDEGPSQIAEILSEEYGISVSRDAIYAKTRLLRNEGAFTDLIDKPQNVLMPHYEKHRAAYESEEILEKTFEVPKNNVIQFSTKPRLKILHLGDLHIPFEVEDQVQEAINMSATADICVASEISDFYSISRFNKNFSIPLEVEIDKIIRLYEFLSSKFPYVFVIQANHDNRVGKQFTDLPPALALLIKTSNMLRYLARPFANIAVVDQWYIQINDTIFAHAEAFSSVDMKVGVKVRDWMRDWTEALDLQPFRCIVQGHVHQLGVTYRNGTKIIESGCLCYQPDYSVERLYARPQVNGFVEVVQDHGRTNFELTREHRFETPVYKARYNPVGIGLNGIKGA
jgi:hypothetical protein